MKKLLALTLAVLMMISLALPVFAEENASIKLTITNDKASTNISIAGQTINAYKLFDVTASGTNYAYYLADNFKTEAAKGILEDTYFELREAPDGKINVVPTDACTQENALAIAKQFVDEGLLTDATADVTATVGAQAESVELTLPSAGYWLVVASGKDDNNSTVNSALIMQTLTKSETLAIKASAPKIDKKIGTEHGASYDIGASIPFTITVNAPSMVGYDTYEMVISDTLSNGLTAPAASAITVKANGNTVTLPEGAIAVDGQNITVTIANALPYAGMTITVEYNAVLNADALNTDKVTNTVSLEYSNDPYSDSTGTTPSKEDKVYNFDVIIDKYIIDTTKTDSKGGALEGAKFVLGKAAAAADATAATTYVYYKNTAGIVTWGAEADATVLTTDEDGVATFTGIAAGNYILKEVEAPTGYNLLKDPVNVAVTAEYDDEGEITGGAVEQTATGWGVTQSVGNQAGAILPSTGGMGTTLFYVLGTLMVLGTGVLLVTKHRMRQN